VTRHVSLSQLAEINPSMPAAVRNAGLDSLVPFLPMSAVSEQGHASYEQRRPIRELLKGFTYFERGDLLLAKITPCFENGKAAFLGDLPENMGFGSTEFHVLRPRPDVDPRYLFHAVWGNAFRRAGAASFTGSAGQKRLPASFFDRYKVPLPPLAEQRRIAAMLDKADAIRRKRQESLRLLDEFLRSAFLEMFGDPVRNEKGWRKISLGELLPDRSLIVDGPFGSSLKPESYVELGVRVIRNFNIKDDRFDESAFKCVTGAKFEEVKRSEVKAGDVLISTKGTLGNVCLMPQLPGNSVLSASGTVRVRLPDEVVMRRQFLVSQMVAVPFKRYLKRFEAGTNQKYLNLAGIRRFEVAVPPVELQDSFVKLRDRVVQHRARHSTALETSRNLFDSLAQRAFEGAP
jgi:type I restriction enzyme S subunit